MDALVSICRRGRAAKRGAVANVDRGIAASTNTR